MASSRPTGLAAVMEQDGDRVVISLPMVGFPDGFRLRKGDKVAVLPDSNGGAAVQPYTEAVIVDDVPKETGEQLTSQGLNFGIQAASVRVMDTPGNRYALFIVQNESPDVPPQVLSIRRVP